MSNNIVSHGKRMVREDLIKKLLKGEYSVKLKDITNIQSLTDEQINELKAGDIVLKKTGDQTHAYIVSYKEEGQGICLTYADATYLETISYDYIECHWVYNSKDSTIVASKDYVDSLLSGALKREIVETLPTEDIDTNTIYMVLNTEASTEGNVYDEYMYISNAWELIGSTATSGGHVYLNTIKLELNQAIRTVFFQLESHENLSTYTTTNLKTYIGNLINNKTITVTSDVIEMGGNQCIATSLQKNGSTVYVNGAYYDSTSQGLKTYTYEISWSNITCRDTTIEIE